MRAVTKPCDDFAGLAVDSSHVTDMVILLSYVALIHTYGVNPEQSIHEVASLGQVSEEGEQVWFDAERLAIQHYLAIGILRAPDVGQSDITNSGDMMSLDATADEIVMTKRKDFD